MLASGFTNAPISQYLLFTLIFFSIATSITDSKHLFYIQIVPHLWPYAQAWRILAWQACYLNSTEVLFAGMTVYHLRIIERLWGPRKFGSFLVSILPYTTILPPLLMASILRPLSLYRFNYLPAGPTALIFAVLAQYHAVIPHVYKYRILTSGPTTPGQLPPSLTFSDKSTTYLLAGQLALSQVPGSLLSAVVGWIIGHAWRRELFPGAMRWRLPRWVIKDKSGGERYEGLRRRLEGEGAAAASASGVEGRVGDEPQRRPIGTQILDQFRGAIR